MKLREKSDPWDDHELVRKVHEFVETHINSRKTKGTVSAKVLKDDKWNVFGRMDLSLMDAHTCVASSFFGGKGAKALSVSQGQVAKILLKLPSLDLFRALFCISSSRDSDFGTHLLIWCYSRPT